MLRTLLTDRFGLVVHQETRELPVYALVVAREDRKFGPDLNASKLDCASQARAGRAGPPPGTSQQPAEPTCGMRIAPGQMVIGGTPISQFASVLSQFVQRVVLDRTQLDRPVRLPFELDARSDAARNAASRRAGIAAGRSERPVAVCSAAGTARAQARGPRAPRSRVLVIDRVDRPTPD